MGSRPERGAYGNARGKPDKQVRARRNREESPRHQAAREEVQRSNSMLEEIERKAMAAATHETGGASGMTTTLRERMNAKHREAMAAAAANAKQASPSAQPQKGRFAACHCSHAGHPNEKCRMCVCPVYRPVTAPDPTKSVVAKVKNINELLVEGRNSAFDETVKLTARIDELLNRLKLAVLDEDRKVAEERAREAAREKVRSRMAELQAEMDKLQAELGEPAPAKKPRSKVTRKPYDGPPLVCPECGRDDIKNPQGLGRHRSSTHGVAGTSRE